MMIMDASQLFTFGSVQYSLGIGILIGYTFKKMFKLFLLLAGFYVASIVYLAQKGIIILNQEKLQEFVQSTIHTVSTELYQFGYALTNFAGFGAGFLVGWKLG